MKYRRLPRTDLTLSEVGFGLWTVATDVCGKIDEFDGVRLLQEAADLGVTFFDTADCYGDGYGEEIIFKALPRMRHDIVIATKVGYDFYGYLLRKNPLSMGQEAHPQCFDPDFIRYACEQSLRRLHTDYIDLYQLHDPGMETLERDEVFETLEQLVKEGKIRYYAVALGPDREGPEKGTAAMRYRDVSALQISYNMFEREPARSLMAVADELGVGLISRNPLASDVRATVNPARFLAEDTGRTLAQSAVAFCLAQPSISSVLPDFTNLQLLQEYAAAAHVPPLSDEELETLAEFWREGCNLEQPVHALVEDE